MYLYFLTTCTCNTHRYKKKLIILKDKGYETIVSGKDEALFAKNEPARTYYASNLIHPLESFSLKQVSVEW